MAEHDLKCWPGPFAAILSGEKRHEIRRDDREYAVGDTLRLMEWRPRCRGDAEPLLHAVALHFEYLPCPVCGRQARVTVDDRGCHIVAHEPNDEHPEAASGGAYTAREVTVRVTYKSDGGTWGLPADLCVMSIEVVR